MKNSDTPDLFVKVHGSRELDEEHIALDLEVVATSKHGAVGNQQLELTMNNKSHELRTGEDGRIRAELVFPTRMDVRQQLITKVFGSAKVADQTEIVHPGMGERLKNIERGLGEAKKLLDAGHGPNPWVGVATRVLDELSSGVKPRPLLDSSMIGKNEKPKVVMAVNTTEQFQGEVLASSLPVLIYIASGQGVETSSSGRRVIFDDLAKSHAGDLKVVSLTYSPDDPAFLSKVCSQYGIVPTDVILFSGGHPIDIFRGNTSKKEMQALVNKNLFPELYAESLKKVAKQKVVPEKSACTYPSSEDLRETSKFFEGLIDNHNFHSGNTELESKNELIQRIFDLHGQLMVFRRNHISTVEDYYREKADLYQHEHVYIEKIMALPLNTDDPCLDYPIDRYCQPSFENRHPFSGAMKIIAQIRECQNKLKALDERTSKSIPENMQFHKEIAKIINTRPAEEIPAAVAELLRGYPENELVELYFLLYGVNLKTTQGVVDFEIQRLKEQIPFLSFSEKERETEQKRAEKEKAANNVELRIGQTRIDDLEQTKLIREIMKESGNEFVGRSDWLDYFSGIEVPDDPPLPSPDKLIAGIREIQAKTDLRCQLIYIPSKINLKGGDGVWKEHPLTLEFFLLELSKRLQGENRNMKLPNIPDLIAKKVAPWYIKQDFYKKSTVPSGYYLMPLGSLPESHNKTYDEQAAMLQELSAHFRTPSFMQFFCHKIMHFLQTGRNIYDEIPYAHYSCEDRGSFDVDRSIDYRPSQVAYTSGSLAWPVRRNEPFKSYFRAFYCSFE